VSNDAGSDTFVQTIHIQILEFPNAEFDIVLLPDGVVQFVGNDTSNAELTWDFGDGSPVLVSTDTVMHQYVNGTYTVSLVASNSCGASVFQQMIEVTTGSVGTQQEELEPGILMYPNPANNYLVVDASGVKTIVKRIRLLDFSGRIMIETNEIQGGKTTITLSQLPAGAYWVEVMVETGQQRWIFIKQ
ncbi:MAG: T9SS type A sorting domain-containing protein, partial [Saprospiraceae bacterium]|nr:T9SS type A sorting domain-containing protein [Saprospiraceae bacterium]